MLELCDPGNVDEAVMAEQNLNDIDEEFDEDFALATETDDSKKFVKKSKIEQIVDHKGKQDVDDELTDFEGNEFDRSDVDSDGDVSTNNVGVKKKKSRLNLPGNDIHSFSDDSSDQDSDGNDDESDNGSGDEVRDNENVEGVWEDIYGRLRTSDGSVIQVNLENSI